MNTTEHPESPAEEPRETAPEQASSGTDESVGPSSEDDARTEAPQETPAPSAEATRTTIYVRRRRTPALGFWVLLSFLVPAVVALLIAPFFQFGDLRGVVNFALLAAVVVGLPLAAIAAFIDARRHRGPRRDRR